MLLLVTDDMHLTLTGLSQGEAGFAFRLHLILHHQASGVMEYVTSDDLSGIFPSSYNQLFKSKSDVQQNGPIYFTF